MQKKIALAFIIAFLFILDNSYAKMQPQTTPFLIHQGLQSKPNKKSHRFIRKIQKRIQKKQLTPPNDDLWVLQLIFLVAFIGIVTFALSAIMLAIHGMSSLWLTLFIVGGIIGVLPLLIIGAALLFT